MTTLIAGAGIGGLALGRALSRVGIEAEVHESWPEATPGAGAFLNLSPNGMKALRAIGAADSVANTGTPSTGIEFYNYRGRQIGKLDSSEEATKYGATNIMIRRADLHQILLETAQSAGVTITWGHRLEAVEETPDRVQVAFAGGDVATGSVLIGADGVHSQTRSHVAGDAIQPKYLGLVDVAGFSPVPPPGITPGPQRMVFGRHAFFSYYIAPSGETWWFCNLPQASQPGRDDLRATAAEQWRSRLLDLHADDPSQIAQILKDSAPPVGAWPLTDLASIPKWHTKRVCLVGDAAHATSPSAGQGASLALEDAVVLAHQMAAHGDKRQAFAAFETQRRPRVESLIQLARRNSNTKTPGPIAGLFRDLLLPVFLRIGANAIGKQAYTYQPPTLENTPSAHA
jgi:2-polyprenyl-6-methoxyphenol hydroxylase-like FAD-dependent oxidoreductase